MSEVRWEWLTVLSPQESNSNWNTTTVCRRTSLIAQRVNCCSISDRFCQLETISWSDEYWVLLQHVNSRAKICHDKHERIGLVQFVENIFCADLYDPSVAIFCFHQDNMPHHNTTSNHLKLVWLFHCTQIASTITRSQSSRAPLSCCRIRDLD